jgi:hypothetical protein
MKVNGIEYNFNRMLKVELINPGRRDNNSLACTIEYCPYKDETLCPRLEAKVTDIPSADENDLPGYTAEVKIYNPNKELLDLIVANSKWLILQEDKSEYSNSSDEKKMKLTKNNLQNYYNQRLQVKIYAGYYNGLKEVNGKTLTVGYSHIFSGYVNGSALTHNGTDDILTLAAHDIPVDRMDVNAVTNSVSSILGDNFEFNTIQEHSDWNKGAKSWDLTFKKYIRFFEREKIVNGSLVATTFADSGSDSWFDVLYVTSVKDYLNARAGKISKESCLSGGLEVNLSQVPNMLGPGENGDLSSFYANGSSLASMLNQLCCVDGLKLGWKRYTVGVDKLTYIVYELGSVSSHGPVDKGDIQIYNYQNLLATPSVSSSGSLDIKMLFNPECIASRRIALVWDAGYTKEHGVAGIASFETSVNANGHIVAPLNADVGSNAALAANQLSGNMALAALREKQDGYMFNTGFPITKVVHSLSTHSANWSTQVNTVPMLRGIDMEKR